MINKPTIIITGANGYLGGCLLEYFRSISWNVRALVHKLPKHQYADVDYHLYSMEDPLEPSVFENIDYLVHAAYLRYEKDPNADAINLLGTKRLSAICIKNDIKLVFLSSFSAHDEAASHYGKVKLQCEKLIDTTKDVILKIGFVIGEKGILAEMIERMKSSAFFPLVGGGKQPLQSIYMEDFLWVVEQALVNKELKGVFAIAHNEVVTMKVFYKNLAKLLERKLFLIPIPTSLLYVACKFFERLNIKIPVSSESVLGLKKLITLESTQDQEKLGVEFKNYQEALQLILKK